MKVYVVLRYETEWQELVGVYSTRELAEARAKEVTTYYEYAPDKVDELGHVEEVEVDSDSYWRGSK